MRVTSRYRLIWQTASALPRGARDYAKLCVACHLAPGAGPSQLRVGLYPHPPSLAQGAISEPRPTFWVIKHGLKMSAMPAWGKTLDDAAVWDLVALVRKLPTLTPAAYQELVAAPVSGGGGLRSSDLDGERECQHQ